MHGNGNVVCIEVRENKRQLELRDMWDMIILWNPLRQIQNPSLEIFEVISRIERWVHLSRESLRRQAYLIEMSSEQIRQCLCFGEERRLNGKVTLGHAYACGDHLLTSNISGFTSEMPSENNKTGSLFWRRKSKKKMPILKSITIT